MSQIVSLKDWENFRERVGKDLHPELGLQSHDQDAIDMDSEQSYAVSGIDLTIGLKHRLQQLTDHIKKDLDSLVAVEDALRTETHPLRREGYRNDIAWLRALFIEHQRDYFALKAQVPKAASRDLMAVGSQLEVMNARLQEISKSQANVSGTLTDLMEKLDQNQRTIVQAVLNALEEGRIQKAEIQLVLDEVGQSLDKLHSRNQQQQQIAEIIDSKLDVQHKLKFIIPFVFAQYETEISVGSGIDPLEAVKRLIAKVRGGQ